MDATQQQSSGRTWRLPSPEQAKYWRDLLELALLLLALPWILAHFMRNPRGAVHDPGLASLG